MSIHDRLPFVLVFACSRRRLRLQSYPGVYFNEENVKYVRDHSLRSTPLTRLSARSRSRSLNVGSKGDVVICKNANPMNLGLVCKRIHGVEGDTIKSRGVDKKVTKGKVWLLGEKLRGAKR